MRLWARVALAFALLIGACSRTETTQTLDDTGIDLGIDLGAISGERLRLGARSRGELLRTRGQALTEGSGNDMLYYCDPAGTDARQHWLLEGSGDNPEPDCDGVLCPVVTNVGSSHLTDGRIGAARSFDGDDWINLGDAGDTDGSPGSVSLWFRRADAVGGQMLVGRMEAIPPFRGWMLWLDGSNRLSFVLQHTWSGSLGYDLIEVRTPQTFTDTEWHHAAVTWQWGEGGVIDATDVSIVVDGTPVVPAVMWNQLTGTIYTGAPMTLGGRPYDATAVPVPVGTNAFVPRFFNGDIDDVRYFDHALPLQDMTSLRGTATPSDPRQCGACENACSNGMACDDGYCVAPACPASLLLYADFNENRGNLLHIDAASAPDTPVRILQASIPPALLNTDGTPPFVNGAYLSSVGFRFNGTVAMSVSNAAGDVHALGPDAFENGATISAWIRRESGSNGRAIIGSMRPNGAMDGWMLRVDGGGRLQWQIQSATGSDSMTVNSTPVIPLDTWTHVAMTTGPDAATDTHLYVNGVDVTAATSNVGYTGPPAATVPLYLGGRNDTSSVFVGAIDLVTMFGQTLNPEQVAQLARTDGYQHACAPTWNLACSTGTASCDGLASTGCETNVMPAATTDPVAHCGACNAPDAAGCDTGMPASIAWTEHCMDSADNDGDSEIDCADADCAAHVSCQTTESLCGDGADNDNDGLIDAFDSDCALPAETVCDDGIDNDFNWSMDCDDFSCAYTAACGYFAPESDCTDGTDDNGDGPIDCADPTCQWDPACYVPPEDCWTPGDEDGNGLADCADAACVAEWDVCPPATEQDCFNFGDEDQDGLADCSDPDCASEPGCATGTTPNGGSCSGPMDCANDGQGSLCLPEFGAGVPGGYCSSWCDLANPLTSCGTGLVCLPGLATVGEFGLSQGLCIAPCSSTADCVSGELCRLLRAGGTDVGWVGPPVCAPACTVHADCVQTSYCDLRSGRCAEPEEDCIDINGDDEDDDGLANAADPDCWGTFYPFEYEVNCVDGIDNDDNGDTDCADSACSWFWRCDPTREHACEDGNDNDGDGNADCADEDCQFNDPVCGFVDNNNEAWCAAGNCCTNSIDDDIDGLMDCADPDCMEVGAGTGACVVSETDCSNLQDDDEDGLTDCFDADCACTPGTTPFSGACTTHTDCVAGPSGEAPVCLPSGFLSGTGMSCTHGCSMSAPNCPTDFACVDMLQAPDQGVCLQACIDDSWCSQPGATCDLAEADTVFSSFLGIPVGTCIAGCQSVGCADGLTCDEVTGTCAEGVGLCHNGLDDDVNGDFDCEDARCAGLPECANRGTGQTGAPCAAADDCVGSALSSLCLSEAATGSPGGYCSGYCRMGGDDCALGELCLPADPSNPFETRGICVAACDDGTGPACDVGYACLRTPAAPVLAVCARPCSAATDCEAGSACVDFHCEAAAPEHCGNGWDDDGDGLVDCADAADCPVLDPTCTGDCPGAGACFAPVEGVELCDNGLDDDGNGFADCEDIACGGALAWPFHQALGTYELAADCLAGETCLIGFDTPVELMLPAPACSAVSLRPPGSRCVSDSQCGGFGAGVAQCVLRNLSAGGPPTCVVGPGGETVCSTPVPAPSGVCALTCDVENAASTCGSDEVCVQSFAGRAGHCLDLCNVSDASSCGGDTCLAMSSLMGTGVCGAGCAQDIDCGVGSYCDFELAAGMCRALCETSYDCPAGSVCDAFSERCSAAIEDCEQLGDEDNNGVADCADPLCAPTQTCINALALTDVPDIELGEQGDACTTDANCEPGLVCDAQYGRGLECHPPCSSTVEENACGGQGRCQADGHCAGGYLPSSEELAVLTQMNLEIGGLSMVNAHTSFSVPAAWMPGGEVERMWRRQRCDFAASTQQFRVFRMLREIEISTGLSADDELEEVAELLWSLLYPFSVKRTTTAGQTRIEFIGCEDDTSDPQNPYTIPWHATFTAAESMEDAREAAWRALEELVVISTVMPAERPVSLLNELTFGGREAFFPVMPFVRRSDLEAFDPSFVGRTGNQSDIDAVSGIRIDRIVGGRVAGFGGAFTAEPGFMTQIPDRVVDEFFTVDANGFVDGYFRESLPAGTLELADLAVVLRVEGVADLTPAEEQNYTTRMSAIVGAPTGCAGGCSFGECRCLPPGASGVILDPLVGEDMLRVQLTQPGYAMDQGFPSQVGIGTVQTGRPTQDLNYALDAAAEFSLPALSAHLIANSDALGETEVNVGEQPVQFATSAMVLFRGGTPGLPDLAWLCACDCSVAICGIHPDDFGPGIDHMFDGSLCGGRVSREEAWTDPSELQDPIPDVYMSGPIGALPQPSEPQCMVGMISPGGDDPCSRGMPSAEEVASRRRELGRICNEHPVACSGLGTEVCLNDGFGVTCMVCDDMGVCHVTQSDSENGAPIADCDETTGDCETPPTPCDTLGEGSGSCDPASGTSPESDDLDEGNPAPLKKAGDPVTLAHGYLDADFIDLTPPADGPFDLSMSRWYAGNSERAGVLGHRWLTRIDERFIPITYRDIGRRTTEMYRRAGGGPVPDWFNVPEYCLLGTPNANCILHLKPDGSSTLYLRDPTRDDLFVPENGAGGYILPAVLEELPPGTHSPVVEGFENYTGDIVNLQVDETGAAERPEQRSRIVYQWTDGYGLTKRFDGVGRVLEEFDSWGNQLTWCWSNNSENPGRVERVIEGDSCDRDGTRRYLDFEYGVWGLLIAVSDYTGQRAEYTHEAGLALFDAEIPGLQSSLNSLDSGSSTFESMMESLGTLAAHGVLSIESVGEVLRESQSIVVSRTNLNVALPLSSSDLPDPANDDPTRIEEEVARAQRDLALGRARAIAAATPNPTRRADARLTHVRLLPVPGSTSDLPLEFQYTYAGVPDGTLPKAAAESIVAAWSFGDEPVPSVNIQTLPVTAMEWFSQFGVEPLTPTRGGALIFNQPTPVPSSPNTPSARGSLNCDTPERQQPPNRGNAGGSWTHSTVQSSRTRLTRIERLVHDSEILPEYMTQGSYLRTSSSDVRGLALPSTRTWLTELRNWYAPSGITEYTGPDAVWKPAIGRIVAQMYGASRPSNTSAIEAQDLWAVDDLTSSMVEGLVVFEYSPDLPVDLIAAADALTFAWAAGGEMPWHEEPANPSQLDRRYHELLLSGYGLDSERCELGEILRLDQLPLGGTRLRCYASGASDASPAFRNAWETVREANLSRARSVDRWIRFTSRDGVDHWYAQNHLGQTLLMATDQSADDLGWHFQLQQFDDLGHVVASQTAAWDDGNFMHGPLTRYFYDDGELNFASRDNLIRVEVHPAPTGSGDQDLLALAQSVGAQSPVEPLITEILYEARYNSPVLITSPDGQRTWSVPAYAESEPMMIRDTRIGGSGQWVQSSPIDMNGDGVLSTRGVGVVRSGNSVAKPFARGGGVDMSALPAGIGGLVFGPTTTSVFDPDGRLLQMALPDGTETTSSYADGVASWQPEVVTVSASSSVRNASVDGVLTSLLGAAATDNTTSVTRIYDRWGRVTTELSPDGIESLSTYDGFHRPLSGVVSPSGGGRLITWAREFDGRGRTTWESSTVHDPNLLRVDDSSGSLYTESRTVYSADSSQQVAACVSATVGGCDVSTSTAFDCYDESSVGEDPASAPSCPRWVTHEFDQEDRVVSVRQHSDTVEVLDYDALGRLRSRWSGLAGDVIEGTPGGPGNWRQSEAMHVTFDALGRVIRERDASGHYPHEVANPDGAAFDARYGSDFAYDSFGRAIGTRIAGGGSSVGRYDAAGRLVEEFILDEQDDIQQQRLLEYQQAELVRETALWSSDGVRLPDVGHEVRYRKLDALGRPRVVTQSEIRLESGALEVVMGTEVHQCSLWSQSASTQLSARSDGSLSVLRTEAARPGTTHNERAWSGRLASPVCSSSGLVFDATLSVLEGVLSVTTNDARSGETVRTTSLDNSDLSIGTATVYSVESQWSALNGWPLMAESETGISTSWVYDWLGNVRQRIVTNPDSAGLDDVESFSTSDLQRVATQQGADGRRAEQEWDHLGRPISRYVPTVSGDGVATDGAFEETFAYPSPFVSNRTRTSTAGGSTATMVDETTLNSATLRAESSTHNDVMVMGNMQWHYTGALQAATRTDFAPGIRIERQLDGIGRPLVETTSVAGATSPESTIDITYGLADGRSIDRVGAILLDGEEIYRLHDVDNQRHPLTESFAAGQTGVTSASQPPLLTSTLGWESGRIAQGQLGFGAPAVASPWLAWQNQYNTNGQLYGRDWGVQQAGNPSLVSLASEARSFTSDGRAAAHGWQWHNEGTLGEHSQVRGFEYDHRGFITRLIERTGRIDAQAVSGATTLAGWSLDGGVSVSNSGTAGGILATALTSPGGTTTESLYVWSQHGTLLSQSEEVLAGPSGALPAVDIWSTTRGSGTTNTQTPLMSSVRTSLTAPDSAYDAVTWDAWGRFTSHGGVTFDTIAFDDRPTQVTVDDFDIATPEAEHAASKRHHDPLGREVLEERTAVGGTVERITKVWVGSRLLVERDDGGWARTWHQRATDAYPFAYTITCDDTVDTNACLQPPEWLGGAGSAIAVDAGGQVTYALIHNYRGDVIGLLNEQGDIVEQYQYDLQGRLSVRACDPTGGTDSTGENARPVACDSTPTDPLPGAHASEFGNILLYAGNHRDPVTGQYRMGARWYSPTLRMFLSRDPAGYAFSFDEWAYTVGDPWNFVDRTGWGAEKPALNRGQIRALERLARTDPEQNPNRWERRLQTVERVFGGLAAAGNAIVNLLESAFGEGPFLRAENIGHPAFAGLDSVSQVFREVSEMLVNWSPANDNFVLRALRSALGLPLDGMQLEPGESLTCGGNANPAACYGVSIGAGLIDSVTGTLSGMSGPIGWAAGLAPSATAMAEDSSLPFAAGEADITPVAVEVATTVLGARGGGARAPRQGGVYRIWDKDGNLLRTGRTNDFARRASEHRRDPRFADGLFERRHSTNSRVQQRGLEQLLFDELRGEHDMIRPISQRNPLINIYINAALRYLQETGRTL